MIELCHSDQVMVELFKRCELHFHVVVIVTSFSQRGAGRAVNVILERHAIAAAGRIAIWGQLSKGWTQNRISGTGDGVFGPIAKSVVLTRCAAAFVNVVRPRVRATRTSYESTFIDIQDTVIVVVDIVFICDAIIVGISPEIVSVIQISFQRRRVTSIGGSVIVGISQLECGSVMTQSADVCEIISCFVRGTVVQTVDTNIRICSTIAIGVVVAQPAFSNIRRAVIVAVEVKDVAKVIAVCVDGR